MIRALTVLATAFCGREMGLQQSVARAAGRSSVGAVACERTSIAGVEALVAEPRQREGSDRTRLTPLGSAPVIVYANACTPKGVEQPAVGTFLAGLARAGFVAVAPELPRVREAEVTPATVAALVAVASAAGSRVTLIGASTGAGLAILAAADPRLADRVDAVLAIAPYASLERIIRLATTGFYGDRRYPAAPLVARATMRSLAASAPDDPAVSALIANCDPERFDGLYEALDPSTRAFVEELSPLARIAHVSAPVELLADPHDAFFPVEEAYALARAGRNVRLTVTPALHHVRPQLRPGLVRLLAALDRTLRRAERAGASPALRPAPAT